MGVNVSKKHKSEIESESNEKIVNSKSKSTNNQFSCPEDAAMWDVYSSWRDNVMLKRVSSDPQELLIELISTSQVPFFTVCSSAAYFGRLDVLSELRKRFYDLFNITNVCFLCELATFMKHKDVVHWLFYEFVNSPVTKQQLMLSVASDFEMFSICRQQFNLHYCDNEFKKRYWRWLMQRGTIDMFVYEINLHKPIELVKIKRTLTDLITEHSRTDLDVCLNLYLRNVT